MSKRFKSYIFSLVCLSGLTALVSVKVTEMKANQIKALLFTEAEYIVTDTVCQVIP